MNRLVAIAWVLIAVLVSTALASEEIVIADFEGGTYGGWKAEGDAFGDAPATGSLPGQQKVSGYKGAGLVNTYRNGDKTTGTLTSPPFGIERDYLTFLIGGGSHDDTALQLIVDGEVVASRSGGNDERLTPAVVDVSDHEGETAVIRIVDRNRGGWGHVNVDHIVLTDEKPVVPEKPVAHSRNFTVEDKYLVMPINDSAGIQSTINLYVDGEEVRRYGLKLAPDPESIEWYAFFTIENYKGQEARVSVKAAEEVFELVRQTDKIPGSGNFYKEPHRPQFHFTQKVGWNNDPNGMTYHEGKWHFFFQHNPVSRNWGNMTWGHAVSEDLIHWEQQPNKLFPKTMAKQDCFSGSAVVDKENTAGWGEDALVAAFTDTGCGEALAYSTDNGQTFTYYEGNPVIKHNGRDPKVFWYEYDEDDQPVSARAEELGGHWAMALYNSENGNNISFYTSTNLKDWKFHSRIDGFYECPELFELAVDGDEDATRWMLLAADAQYVIGSFDGKKFTPDHDGKHRVHWGPYYASQCFNNAPDGRVIQIGWARIDAPGPYNQHFSFPHTLTLRTTDDGIRMFAEPIEEIEELHAATRRIGDQALKADQPVEVPVETDLLDVRLEVEVGEAKAVELRLPGRTVKYDVTAMKLNGAPLEPVDERIQVQVLLDRRMMEIVGNKGRVFITAQGPDKVDAEKVSVIARGGDAELIELEVNEVESIWE